jgi:hypothetical protein
MAEREPVISNEEAHGMLEPFVTLGLLRPSQIDAALKRPLRERTMALQVLWAQGLATRQEQRKVHCVGVGRDWWIDRGIDVALDLTPRSNYQWTITAVRRVREEGRRHQAQDLLQVQVRTWVGMGRGDDRQAHTRT